MTQTDRKSKPRDIRSFIMNESLLMKRRKDIVNVALKLFVEKGFERTSIRDISKACKLTTGGLYRYIGSKDDIVHLLCLESRDSIRRVRQLLENQEDAGVVEGLRKCIAAYIRWTGDLQERNLFYNREIHWFTHEDRAILLESQVKFTQLFEGLIRRGIKQRRFSAKYPRLLAHNIVLLGHDWVLRRWYLGRFLSIDAYIEQQVDMVMKLLSRRGSDGMGIPRCGPNRRRKSNSVRSVSQTQ